MLAPPMILRLNFGTGPTVWYFLFFILWFRLIKTKINSVTLLGVKLYLRVCRLI